MSNQETALDLDTLTKTPITDSIPPEALNAALSSPPFLPFPKALNLRTLTSPTLIPNAIFRSGSLSHLSPPSLSPLFTTYGITTIFDLRSRAERSEGPSPIIDGIETIWIPSSSDVEGAENQILKGIGPSDFVENEGEDGFVKMYSGVLDVYREAFGKVFGRLRDGGPGVLFHCTAGKDRTGTLSAMILALMDTPPELIAQDYELTRVGVEPFREYLLGVLLFQMGQNSEGKMIDQQPPPGFEAMCGVRGLTILKLLEWMDEKWGEGIKGTKYPGVQGYLVKELGLGKEDLEEIKRKLAA